MKARIYKILKRTKVEGPKTRYCIWFQGCSKHCNGCWAIQTWDKNGGIVYEVDDILEDIKNTKGIDGVTFLGGEPFEQLDAITYLAREVQKLGLSVVCFTGLKIEELKDKEVLKYIDLLIDGEYREEEQDFSKPWVGSKNQRYHFLTDYFDESIFKYKNKVEINIQKNGVVFINGMGDFKKLTQNLNIRTKRNCKNY